VSAPISESLVERPVRSLESVQGAPDDVERSVPALFDRCAPSLVRYVGSFGLNIEETSTSQQPSTNSTTASHRSSAASATRGTSHVKDDLERLLSRRVCDGSVELAVEDDDDQIQFEVPRAVPIDMPASVSSFVPIRVSVSAQLADSALTLPVARRGSWP
jgi:hypothetical protein